MVARLALMSVNRPSGSNYLGQDLVWDDGIYTGNNNNFMSKVFANPQMNQMYLRRIRTLMDELLQPVGTPTGRPLPRRTLSAVAPGLQPRTLKPP